MIEQIAGSIPGFILFVLAPAVLRLMLDKLIGVDYYIYGASFEDALQSLTLTGFFYPFFEELTFRGLPLMLLGQPGAWLGTMIWALMHPAWQLRYLAGIETWKKVAATATSLLYYLPSGYFYLQLWAAGAGTVAIFWHMALNTTVILSEQVKEYTSTKRERGAEKKEKGERLPRIWRWRGLKLEPKEPLFVKRKGEEKKEEAETPGWEVEGLRFVRHVREGKETLWEGEETQYRFIKKRK